MKKFKNSKTICFHMGHSDLEYLNFCLMIIIEIITSRIILAQWPSLTVTVPRTLITCGELIGMFVTYHR